VIALVASLVAAPLLAAAPPQFAVPPLLPPATAGTKYTYSFCRPLAATRNGVCGSLKTPSANPAGGSGAPYIFRLAWRGFPPTGLSFSNRTGILTGTVASNARARTYAFTICASSNRGEGSTCRASALQVRAAPRPQGFADEWKGSYTRTFHTLRCGDAVLTGAATADIRTAGASYEVTLGFVGDGFSQNLATCAIEERYNNSVTLTMNPAAATSLTGARGGIDWALTLNGANEIVGTGVHELQRYELTLKRAP
jgi:hypothetical protein